MAYLIAAGLVVAMTITPLPAPPSWLVLAYLSLELDAHAAGIVLAGALGATAGRTMLVMWTRAIGPRLLGSSSRANLAYLAAHLRGRGSTLGVAAVLAASPPPAGALYTAAGILRINLALVAVSCFAGRLVTYGLGVALTGAAAGQIADRLREAAGPWSIALGIAAVAAALWLLNRVDWRILIEARRLRLRPLGAGAGPGLRLGQEHPEGEAEAPERQRHDAEHEPGDREAPSAEAAVGGPEIVERE